MSEASVIAAVRELKDTVAHNSADLKIQFERIGQMQAEIDPLRMASAGARLAENRRPIKFSPPRRKVKS